MKLESLDVLKVSSLLRDTRQCSWDSWCKFRLYPKILIVVLWSPCYRNRLYCSILRNIVTDQLDYRLLEKTLSLFWTSNRWAVICLLLYLVQLKLSTFFSGLLTDNDLEPVAYYTNKSDKSTWEQEENGTGNTVNIPEDMVKQCHYFQQSST